MPKSDKERDLAHGISVPYTKPRIIRPDSIGRFRAHNDPVDSGYISKVAQYGRGAEKDINFVFHEGFIYFLRILRNAEGNDAHPAARVQYAHIEQDHSNEMQRGDHGKMIIRRQRTNSVLIVAACDQVQIPVLMQYAFWITCGPGGIDRKGGIMIIHLSKARKGFTLKDFRPGLVINHQLASAVPADKRDALLGIVLLQHNESRPGLPHANHGDHGLHASWKQDVHEIFPSYTMRHQIAVHLSGDQVQLPVRNSLSIPHG